MKSRNFYILLALDLCLVLLAHWLAYVIRFEASIPPEQWVNFLQLTPFFVLVKLGCFFFYDLYRGMWRYTSLPDLLKIFQAATAASLLLMAGLLLGQRFYGFSRSVFALDWMFTLAFISGLRIMVRMVYGVGWMQLPSLFRKAGPTAKRCVLLGAGEAAEALVRELQSRPERALRIIAVFDDAPDKQGRRLHGLPIVGPLSAMPYWTRSERAPVSEALIAMPSISGERMREVVALCEEAGLAYRTIPSLGEIVQGRVSVKALRDVDYRDLIAREPQPLDEDLIQDYVKGATVLVTGAGGSIGSELCRQLANFAPGRLLLLDANEYNLYSLHMELTHELGFEANTPLLGDLRDRAWTQGIFAEHKPVVVFHAAAYKHVPMLETQPWQAVLNNVLGTEVLLDTALDHKAERVLLVSTDKAVRPANVMGATKRLTELLMLDRLGASTRLMAVRFGNVLGSAGSVIPLFRRQIERGGPVTVTHPDIVRFFMTVDEACRLILQAAGQGKGGEIYVLKMGKPVKIADMARDLIRLSGRDPDKDVAVRFIGLRPGEKLFEELITEDEQVLPTAHEHIMVLGSTGNSPENLKTGLEKLYAAAARQDSEAIRKLLQELVPEYNPAKSGAGD